MTGDWKARARARVGAAADATLASYREQGPLTSDEFDTQMRANQLQSLQALDPGAHLEAELVLRLMGDQLPEGMLLVGQPDPVRILNRLQAIIVALCPTPVAFGVTAVSPGSTIVHMRPVYRVIDAGDDDGAQEGAGIEDSDDHVAAENADQAVQEMITLVMAAEAGEALEAAPRVLEAFERFVTVLDDSEIDVDLGWHAEAGTVRSGRLTAQGRHHTQTQMRPQVTRQLRRLSGYITELSAPSGLGKIVIRGGLTRRSGGRHIEIDAEELAGLRLAFGQWVEIEVTEETKRDPLTGRTSSRYLFHSLIEQRN